MTTTRTVVCLLQLGHSGEHDWKIAAVGRDIQVCHEPITLVVITDEPPQQCDLCGNVAELRPYGPNGEAVCFDCGMRNLPATEAAFDALTDVPRSIP